MCEGERPKSGITGYRLANDAIRQQVNCGDVLDMRHLGLHVDTGDKEEAVHR